MRRNKSWILAIMAMALLAFAAGGCVEPLENNGPGIDPDAVKLPIRLYIPGAMPATKADSDDFKGFTGDVDGVSPESKIYSVQVWMFNHPKTVDGVLIRGKDTETAVAYTEATINWTPENNINGSGYYPSSSGHWDGDIYELPMLIPTNIFDRDINDLRFDFYVLANGSSIGNPASREMSRGELKALTFGYTSATSDDYFGFNPVSVLSENGPSLPIAGFFNKSENDTGEGVDLKYLHPEYEQGENFDIKAHTPVVQLKRAVSKIRFVFSRPTNMPDVTITDVILDNGIIPNTTWVFENTTNLIPSSSGYYSNPDSDIPGTSLEFSLATDKIGQIQDPSTLTTDYYNANPVGEETATAQGYDNYLTAAIQHKETINEQQVSAPQATEKVVYLRESDKAIKGTIKYRLPGMTDTDTDLIADFEMTLDSNPPKGADYNNFLRNHYWIVYAYFQGGKLYVKPTVAPWVNAAELEYTLKLNTNMRLFDSWLYRYDTVDQDYSNWTNWAGSHMVVSGGRVENPVAPETVSGRPLRSPQIELVTTGVADPEVSGSGTFELIVDNDDFEIIRANKSDTGVVTSYEASTNGKLTILAGDDVHTFFYIVPKVDVTPSNPEAKVSLIYNDPVTGPQRVTYNYSSLPGYSDDSSEIWVWYVIPNEYNNNLLDPDDPESRPYLKMYFQDYNHPLVPTSVQN